MDYFTSPVDDPQEAPRRQRKPSVREQMAFLANNLREEATTEERLANSLPWADADEAHMYAESATVKKEIALRIQRILGEK